MPNYTTNLNLEQPLDDEQYDVGVTRRNNQKIDEFAGQVPARALTADVLTTARNINGVSFKGDENITLPTVNLSGNQTVEGVKTFSETIQGTADKAIKDQNGDTIDETYIKSSDLLNKWHVIKSYEDNGETYTDAEGLADVRNYVNSSFDILKITVNGDSMVSDDGLVTNLSNSNSVYSKGSLPASYNTFEIYLGKYNFNSMTSSDWMAKTGASINANIGGFHCRTAIDGIRHRFRVWLGTGSGTWDIANGIDGNYDYSADKDIELKLVFDGVKYTLYTSVDGGSWRVDNEIINSNKIAGNLPFVWGGLATSHDYTLDLKYFRIYADNKLIFQTEKDGVDTIKSDNYTATGVTITPDGVASGFSSANDLVTNFDFYPTGKWSIEGAFTTPTTTISNRAVICRHITNVGLQILLLSDYHICFLASSNGTSYDIADTTSGKSTTALVTNSRYFFKLEFTGSQYNLYIKSNFENNWFLEASVNNSNAIHAPSSHQIRIGKESGSSNIFDSSIDLNEFKVYYGKKLVYQSCLKIPYTLSKTGSKIVDDYYRSRVVDMYNQFGYAPYYTLSDTNFTLPMGEIYGLMPQWTTKTPVIPAFSYGVNLVGDLTNTSGVLSGFSSTKYAQINGAFVPENNTWEMNFKVTTGADVATRQEIYSDGINGIELQIYNTHLLFELNNGEHGTGSYTILADTTYYIRIKFTGTAYTVSYSTDGTTYTDDITYTSSTLYNGDCLIFIGIDKNNTSEAWGGTIDLNGCNIKVGNNIVWQGIEPVDTSIYATSRRPAVVVETFTKGTFWYRLYSDGWCEQGGTAPVGQVTGSTYERLVNVNLLKPYKTTNYSITSTVQGDGVTSNVLYDVVSVPYSKNRDAVTFAVSPTVTNTFVVPYIYWEAKGYIK